MFRLIFLALLTACAVLASAATAQYPPSGSRINPAPGAVGPQDSRDDVTTRRVMRTYAGCVARARRRWAEQVLALPLFGPEQLAMVARGLGGSDDCFGAPGLMLRFRPPSVIGGMAEQFIELRFARSNPDLIARLADADLERMGLTPRNGNESFALCVVRRDSGSVREFVMSQPASPREREAARRLVPNLGPCLEEGQTLSFNVTALRALLAPALYRTFTAVGASRS